MAKIFEWKAGSWLDTISGIAGTPTNAVNVRTEKGWAVKCSDADPNIVYGNTFDLGTDDFSIELSVYLTDYSTPKYLCGKYADSNNYWDVSIVNPGRVVFLSKVSGVSDCTFTTNVYFQLYKFTMLSLVCDRVNGWSVKVDNKPCTFLGNYVTANNLNVSSGFTIGGKDTTGLNGTIGFVEVQDEVLSQSTLNKLYSNFLNASPLSYDTYVKPDYGKPLYDYDEGTLCHLTMNPINGIDVDISGNGKNWNYSNVVQTKDGVLFNGNNSESDAVNWGNINYLAFRIKLNSITEKILEGSAATLAVYATGGTLTAVDWDIVYINGSVNSTVEADIWYNVVLTSSTNIDFSACTLGLNGSTYGAFEIADLKSSSSEINAAAYHNSFIKTQISLTNQDDAVGTFPKGWVKGTGEYEVDEITTADPVLKDIIVGSKLTKCTSAGTIAYPSKWTHGEMCFDVMKGGNSNAILFIFIGNDQSTGNVGEYRLDITTEESIRLVNSTISFLFQTAASYISINTRYRLKVARLQSEGVFKDIDTLQVSDLDDGTPTGSYTYDSFTSHGRYGFRAINNGTGFQMAGTEVEIPIVDTEKYLVEFDAILSGISPVIRFRTSRAGAVLSDVYSLVNGRNSIIITATGTDTGVLNFENNSTATDYTTSNITIRRIYPACTFAVFIQGGAFGTDGWTLVDATGDSDTNPVTDSTYTESEYIGIDADADDEVGNILIKNGIIQ